MVEVGLVSGSLRWRALSKEAESRCRRFRYGSGDGKDGFGAERGITMEELGDEEETREKMRERRDRKQGSVEEKERFRGIVFFGRQMFRRESGVALLLDFG